MQREEELARLLAGLFDPEELRRFLRQVPESARIEREVSFQGSGQRVAEGVAAALGRRGLVDAALGGART